MPTIDGFSAFSDLFIAVQTFQSENRDKYVWTNRIGAFKNEKFSICLFAVFQGWCHCRRSRVTQHKPTTILLYSVPMPVSRVSTFVFVSHFAVALAVAPVSVSWVVLIIVLLNFSKPNFTYFIELNRR